MNNDKIAYTVPEALAALGIGRTNFYKLANEGKVDLRKLGGRTLVTAVSLHRLINNAEPYVSTDHPNSEAQRANPTGAHADTRRARPFP
jgi:hypothetical protein